MRTSIDVYNRIKHDDSYDVNKFVVGYTDRFTGIVEKPLTEFGSGVENITLDTYIPWHRVMYFKCDEEILWDRKTKMDKIFESPLEN